jgi:hypothetical protein
MEKPQQPGLASGLDVAEHRYGNVSILSASVSSHFLNWLMGAGFLPLVFHSGFSSARDFHHEEHP